MPEKPMQMYADYRTEELQRAFEEAETAHVFGPLHLLHAQKEESLQRQRIRVPVQIVQHVTGGQDLPQSITMSKPCHSCANRNPHLLRHHR